MAERAPRTERTSGVEPRSQAPRPARAPRAPLTDTQRGYLLGLFTVTIWGSYLAMNRFGTASGLTMADMSLLRYGPGALILLPYFLRHQPATLGGVGWRRGAILALILGPCFTYLAVGGYYFAPLPHGAVFQPSGLILSGLVLGVVVLREPLTPLHLLGVAIIVAGLVVVAGPALLTGGRDAWIGDILFLLAGCSWGLYTVLTKRWATPPITATAIISVLSSVVFVPLFFATDSLERIAALPWPNLLSQLFVQGVLSAVVATIAYTRAAQLLGASRVSAFPALVPVVAILVGVPVTNEWPTPLQGAGIVLVVVGLMTAIGAFNIRRGVRPVRVREPEAVPLGESGSDRG